MIEKTEQAGAKAGKQRLAPIGRFLAVSVFVLGLACPGAWADEGDAVKLESVKVTANKMEEDPMDVPQSLTIIDEIELREKGMTSISDVIDEVPGMSYSADHGLAVNFRGLNASMFTLTNPVTLYVDGVGHSGRSGFDTSLMNVERVEVLRGPSSALYGKNAMGAVINVITKDPTNTWEGRVGSELGSRTTLNSFASANGPLVEDLLYLGFSAQFQRDDGYIENEYPGVEEDSDYERDLRLNAYLLYKPHDDLRVRLSAHHAHKREGRLHEYGMGLGKSLDDFDADDGSSVSEDMETELIRDDDSHSLQVEYAFDAVKLDSITTHKYYRTDGVYDGDFDDAAASLGYIMYDDMETRNIAQELRLSSLNEKGFRWLAGVYGDVERRKQGPYGQQVADMGGMEMDAHSTQDAYTVATFAQGMIPLGNDFELTLGGRFQRVSKKLDLDMFSGPIGATALTYEMEARETWDTFLPKVALTYDVTPNWTAYASYAHGYMPGGFNYFAMGGTVDENSFEPEQSKNYELGLKAAYDDFTLGAAVYYMDIKDIHVYKTVGPMYVTDNAKKAHSMGVELESTYRPVDTLQLSGSVTLTRAKYDDYDAGGVNFDGEDIDQTPAYVIRLGAAYHAPSGLYARLDGRHHGSRSFYDDYNKNFTEADPYTVIDTKVGYRFDNFDVYGYVDNLLGKQYVTAFRSNNMTAIAGLAAPRTFGVGVVYNF